MILMTTPINCEDLSREVFVAHQGSSTRYAWTTTTTGYVPDHCSGELVYPFPETAEILGKSEGVSWLPGGSGEGSEEAPPWMTKFQSWVQQDEGLEEVFAWMTTMTIGTHQ